jgi:hypothetical protein
VSPKVRGGLLVMSLCAAIMGGMAAVRPRHHDVPNRTLIVVAAEPYFAELTPWLKLRLSQGFEVHRIDPEPLLRDQSNAEAVERLRAEIARLVPADAGAVQSASGPRDAAGDDELNSSKAPVEPPGNDELHRASPAAFVLLVGDAPGPRERLDSSRLIPTAIEVEKARPRLHHAFASDQTYALPRERGSARLAVGRWPVRSPEDVAAQVQKALNYELGQTPGPHRRDVTFIGTTPNYDPLLDPILERVAMSLINGQIRPHWGVRAIYSSPRSDFFPGPDETQRQVAHWLEESTPFTLFAGHGYDRGVDFVRYGGREFCVLDTEVARKLRGTRPGTILWMSACSCGDFDLPPPYRGLAEELVANPGGPTAVIAGTDETSAYANLLLCLGLAQDVIEQAPATLGEAFLRFKEAAFRPGPPVLRSMLLALEPTEKPEMLPTDHQFLYNLLGDPSLPLNLPRKLPLTAQVTESATGDEAGHKVYTIAGALEGWGCGTARVSLLIDRMQMKESVPNPGTVAPDARPAAYQQRFSVANDKCAATEEQVPVRDGHFTIDLSVAESLVPKVRWLQVYVQSPATEATSWRDGVASLAVRLVDEPAR